MCPYPGSYRDFSPYTRVVNSAFSWLPLGSFLVSIVSLSFTFAIFLIGRRLSFRQQRERVSELRTKAWTVLTPIRSEGLNSKIIIMNVARYKRGYDGSNSTTWRGGMYSAAELIEIPHGGVEVILSGVASYYDADHRRTLARTNTPGPTVIEVGHIPWKWIEDIEPDGDEFDGSAIFFVRHVAPGRGPYNFITFKEGAPVPFGPHDRDYYLPIPELGTSRPRLTSWWGFGKSLRRIKVIERRGKNRIACPPRVSGKD